jgi:excisionase family DNA binding protein
MATSTSTPGAAGAGGEPGDPGSAEASGAEALLKPAEVAAMFRVDPKTVTRWAKSGKIPSIRTLGGHRRFRESEVRALLVSFVEHGTDEDAADQHDQDDQPEG